MNPASPASPVIDARDLRVTFKSGKGKVEALQGLSLSVPKGALYVLLGPNGAGKTTLMRCITGLVAPQAGGLSLFGGLFRNGPDAPPGNGHSPGGNPGGDGTRPWLRKLGVLIENPGLYGRLDAREYLGFFASFYGLPDPEARIRSLCSALGFEPEKRPVGKLSQGNRQKLQLVRSLLHAPELLLWDEPTDHLDPASQRDVLKYLSHYLRETGATALVATHRLEQMEAPATHFGFLRRGALAASGPREEILGAGLEERAVLTFAAPMPAGDLAWLEAGFGVRVGAGEHGRVEVAGAGLRARMPELVKALCQRDFAPSAVEPRQAGLAEAYQRYLGDE